MLHVTTSTSNLAWKETLNKLYRLPSVHKNSRYYRDEPVLIEIDTPTLEAIDSTFPMKQEDVDIINNFIVSGKSEEKVPHTWTKLYYHRLFDEPYSQIEYLVKKLQQASPQGDAVISLWDKSIDQDEKVNPCTLVLWARIKDLKLEFHVHAHSSDAYKKLLMNMQEFIAVQHYIAKRLKIQIGKYLHFIDSCHIHIEDVDSVATLLVW